MSNQSLQSARSAMLKTLITAPSTPEDCKKVEEQLTTYHLATLQQQDADPKWMTAIEQHLEQCPSCAEQYRWLQQWEEWENGLDEVAASTVPMPDLGFLRESAESTATAPKGRTIWVTFWEETVGGLLIDLGLELQNALPRQRLAAAGLRSASNPTVGYEIAVETPHGATVHLDIEQAADTPLAILKVTVTTAALTPNELPEVEVVLWIRDQPTKSQFVDRHGLTRFAVASEELPFAKVAVHYLANE